MAEYFLSILHYLLPGDCYDKVFLNFDFTNADCFRLFLSRYIGISLVAGSAILKIPQILKILRAGSVEGLSLFSVILEMYCYLFTFTYNYSKAFPFSTYGESLFLTIQVFLITILIFIYRKQYSSGLLYTVLTLGFMYYLISGLASSAVLAFLQSCGIPILITSRSTQIYHTYLAKSTGQLAFISAFMLWGGSVARVFTTLQETGDVLMLGSYLVGLLLNTAIVFQFLLYWNSGVSLDDKKKK